MSFTFSAYAVCNIYVLYCCDKMIIELIKVLVRGIRRNVERENRNIKTVQYQFFLIFFIIFDILKEARNDNFGIYIVIYSDLVQSDRMFICCLQYLILENLKHNLYVR